MNSQPGIITSTQKSHERDDLVDAMAEAMQNAEMPDLKAIICAFTRKCRGADGIANMLMREYKAAKPGTMIRSMILQMILQGSKAISSKIQARDESMISDEDLDRELAKIMSKSKHKKEEADHGKPASE